MPLSSPILPPRVRAARRYARELVEAAADIVYSQARPMQLVGPKLMPSRGDCSASVTMIYEAAGFPDPNGRKYDGYGYTGSLVSNGHAVSRSNLQPLDLVFYGHSFPRPGFPAGAPTHVAMVMDRKGAIFSFGSDPGPSFKRIDYRSDLHSVRRYIQDLP